MRPPLPRVLYTYVFAMCVAAGAVLGQADFALQAEASTYWNTIGALVGLGLLAEAFALRLRLGSATVSVSFVPYLAAILLLGPSLALAVAGVTAFTAEIVVRRQPFIKVAHNTAAEIIAIGIAGYVYTALGGIPNLESFQVTILAFVACAVTYFVLVNGAAATAVALSTRTNLAEPWREIVGQELLSDVLMSSMSVLLAFLYVNLQVYGLLLLIVPLFFVRHAIQVTLQLEQTNRELLELMVKSIEARDPYTSGHSQRVSQIARLLAREIGLPFKEVTSIETGALLHDVGKIYEEFAPLLRKAGKLTESERQLMRSHVVRSDDLIRSISNLRGAVQKAVRHHHECWDGTGYPDGLAGEEIPIAARIIMIADTTDAMTTDRPYRRALTYERVVAELQKYSGSQFDPHLVEAFRGSVSIRRLVETRVPAVEFAGALETGTDPRLVVQ